MIALCILFFFYITSIVNVLNVKHRKKKKPQIWNWHLMIIYFQQISFRYQHLENKGDEF